MAINREFIFANSRPNRGFAKALAMVLCLVLLICAATLPFKSALGGWLGFVGGAVLFTNLMWFFLYLFNINEKFPPAMLIVELAFLVAYSVLLLIATIVACVFAAGYGSAMAYAIFGFPALGANAGDLVLFIIAWRSGNSGSSASAPAQADPAYGGEEAKY